MFVLIVQIYEIQTEAEAELVLATDVDHIGSVVLSEEHWKDSHLRSAITLVGRAGKKSSLIPLFSDLNMICRCLDYYRPNIIHFCESISLDTLRLKEIERLIHIQATVRHCYPEIAIMRSIPIFEPGKGESFQVLSLAKHLEPYSDYFLTDTILNSNSGKIVPADQPVSGFVGITGRVCDWAIASQLVVQSKIPVILAGGLGPSNVRDAILAVSPSGVDSCSATNAQDAMGNNIRFKKDLEKVRRFITNTRMLQR